MSTASLTLKQDNLDRLATWIDDGSWIVACLCAAWCDTCDSYRAAFDGLAGRHPEKRFVWIDIEDRADLVGDIDVENFPTLLIQRGNSVAFFGTVLPDVGLADRLIQAQSEKSDTEIRQQAGNNAGPGNFNLRARLNELQV